MIFLLMCPPSHPWEGASYPAFPVPPPITSLLVPSELDGVICKERQGDGGPANKRCCACLLIRKDISILIHWTGVRPRCPFGVGPRGWLEGEVQVAKHPGYEPFLRREVNLLKQKPSPRLRQAPCFLSMASICSSTVVSPGQQCARHTKKTRAGLPLRYRFIL